MSLISKVWVVAEFEIAHTGFQTICSCREPLGVLLKIKISVKVSHIGYNDSSRAFLCYMNQNDLSRALNALHLFKLLWAILSYLELFRMVCPLREWYLPSTGLSPSRTYHLLAQRCLVCQSPTLGIDIHSCQTCTLAITNPTSQTFTHSSHKGLPYQNSKEFKLYQ